MARAGDRFEMVDGSTYEVIKPARDTGGEFAEMIFHRPAARFEDYIEHIGIGRLLRFNTDV